MLTYRQCLLMGKFTLKVLKNCLICQSLVPLPYCAVAVSAGSFARFYGLFIAQSAPWVFEYRFLALIRFRCSMYWPYGQATQPGVNAAASFSCATSLYVM